MPSTINVVMTCYFPPDVPERRKYAIDSLLSLIDNLDYPGLQLLLADDSEAKQEQLVADMMLWADKGWKNKSRYTRSYHRGIGASLNTALEEVGGLWMYTTDDWLLTDPLSLEGPARLLIQNGYDLVRLGPVHPDLRCTTRFQAGLGWWLDLDQSYGGFAFATRPFLATKEFVNKIGPFPEMENSYETERLYAERVAHSTSKLAYWGGIDLAGPWEHIGLVEVGYREVRQQV